MNHLGQRLRDLRKARGLTLAQLGQQVGFSASYLSQIERGTTMPSLPKLATLARALAVEVRDLFEEGGSPRCVFRANKYQVLNETDDMRMEMLSVDPLGKSMLAYRLVCQPGAACERSFAYPGEECGLVLQGRLTVTVGEETIVLEPGDSIHYQKHQPHSWRNEGDEECVVIWATSPPLKEDGLRG